MQQYDVIIIGAGPAGAISAYHLARSGLAALILEKTHFPRRKVCGGALTERGRAEIPFDISPVIQRAVDWGYIGFRGKKVCAIHGAQPIAYLVERSSFDDFLLQEALKQGAHCQQGQRFQSFSQSDGRVTVHTQTNTYHARFLIGADGVNSPVARQAGLCPTGDTSLSYEARLAFPEDRATTATDTITFDFGTLSGGYGWVFPKGDHLNVGVYRNWPGQKTARRHLMRFIRQHPGLSEEAILDIRAFPGPLGGALTPLHAGRALLAGDAAHLADPWLGEGLAYALKSGRLAAETILSQSDTPSADLSGYTQQIHTTIVSQFTIARKLSLLINLFYGFNVHFIKRSASLQQMVIDLLRGERSHESIWKELKARPRQILMEIIRGQS